MNDECSRYNEKSKTVAVPVYWLEKLMALADGYEDKIEALDTVNDSYELKRRIPWSQLKGFIESAEGLVGKKS